MQPPKKLPRFPKDYRKEKEVHTCTVCGKPGIHTETHIRKDLIIDYAFYCDECRVEWLETISH